MIGLAYDGIAGFVRLVDGSAHEVPSKRNRSPFGRSERNGESADFIFHSLECGTEGRSLWRVFGIAAVGKNYDENGWGVRSRKVAELFRYERTETGKIRSIRRGILARNS